MSQKLIISEPDSMLTPRTQQLNQNFTSIMNIPTHNQNFLETVLDFIVTTILRNQFQNKEAQANPELLQKINIDPSEFDNYKIKVVKEFEEYAKNKRRSAQPEAAIQIDLSEVLMRCYEIVPKVYFESKFLFDFQCLSKDISRMNEIQEVLTAYLDDVEINLFYQIYNRFNEFLTVILNLNQMRRAIDDNLSKIEAIKRFNHGLRDRACRSALSIVTLQKRLINMEKTISLLQLLKTVHKTVPTINELIQSARFDFAVNLLQHSEETYISKFQHVLALKSYKDTIFIARQKLEQNISTNFQAKTLDYTTQSLNFYKTQAYYHPSSYQTASQTNTGASNNSINVNQAEIDDSMYLNITYLNDTFEVPAKLNVTVLEENSRLSHLSWTHPENIRDPEKEEEIGKIVIKCFNLMQFSVIAMNYRAKVLETLKSFHKSYLNDVKEYCEHIIKVDIKLDSYDNLQQQGSIASNNGSNSQGASSNVQQKQLQDLLEKVQIDLFVKFILFYAEILKRVVKRQLFLFNTVSHMLIKSVIDDYEENRKNNTGTITQGNSVSVGDATEVDQTHSCDQLTEDNSQQQQQQRQTPIDQQGQQSIDDEINILSRLNDVIEEFYQTIINLFKCINERVVMFINLRKLDEEITIPHFRRINNIFYFWDQFLENEVSPLMKIQSEGIQSLKIKAMIKKFNNYFNKIPMTALNNLRIEMERKFIESYHKQEIQAIKQNLEEDKWVPADIPFEYYDIIQYIIGQQSQNNNSSTQQQYLFEEEKLKQVIETPNMVPDQGINTERLMDDTETPRPEDAANQQQYFSSANKPQRLSLSTNSQQDEGSSEKTPQLQQYNNLRILKNELIFFKKRYKLTQAYLLMLKRIYGYLHLIEYFKTMSNDTVKKLIELIKFYNSYTTQLIIGAGATRFDVLKKIMAKNLAISSLCLNFSLQIFPHIQNKIKKSFEPCAHEWIEKEIQKLLVDYQNHNQEIIVKIASLLSERIKNVCFELGQLDWNNPKEKLNTPTRHSAQVLDALRSMYMALEDFYEEEDQQNIFGRIMKEINEIYLKFFKEIEINTKIGARRVKDELEYVQQDICSLGFMKYLEAARNDFDNSIANIIDEKCYNFLESPTQQ